MTETNLWEYKIRLVATYSAGNKEICADLPHLHQSHIETLAFQPGNPGSSALGSSTIQLYPPGTEGYAAAKAYYDQIVRFQRVEWYIGGKLIQAGIITGIRKSYGQNSIYELTVQPDYVLANLSRPFPGELLPNRVTSSTLKAYLGTNELGASDNFNPFTSSNYTSTNSPGNASGTWSGTTDDGLTVVSCSTGNGATLISKTGAASGDLAHSQFVEVTGRLNPSSDATNAGKVGVLLSKSSANANDSIYGFVQAKNVSGRYTLDAWIEIFVGGSNTLGASVPAVLSNVDEPSGYIPLTISLYVGNGGNSTNVNQASLVVNGKIVIQLPTGTDLGTGTVYPGLNYATPASGSATVYLTNLVQMTRFTTDGASTAATFGNGSITTTTNSLPYGTDPGPSFLEVWSRLATREGFYLRYTPQAYVVGTRTLGTIDFAADPGTDRSTSVIYRRDGGGPGTLIDLEFNDNADPLAVDTAISGQSTPDGGGIAYWRDISSLKSYGVIQDEALSFTHSDFTTQRQASRQIIDGKINVDAAGAKSAIVSRDPQVADVARELDQVTIHDPELNVNYLKARIIGRTLDENQPTETLLLDRFSADIG